MITPEGLVDRIPLLREFAALLLELPRDVRDLVEFLRATGWRRDEGRLLTWAAADMAGGTIRLEDARSRLSG